MNEHQAEHHLGERLSFIDRHRFLALIVGSITIAILLVMVSMALYVSSGVSQLDLSRPGYESIREKVSDSSFEGFSADGPINEAALNEFDTLYTKKLKEMQSVDAFGGKVLTPESLQIDQASVTKQR